MNTSPALGFIGLGRMGAPMARNLITAGHRVIVYDIDPVKVEELVCAGAQAAASPADAAARSNLIFSMIMNDTILLEVVLGAEGVLAGAKPGDLYCDLSTVSPGASSKIATALETADIGYLRGKVAGSIALAEAGTLTVFASGRAEEFDRARSVLEVVGERVLYVGQDETALYLKLVHSTIVGVYAALLGEALAFGEKGGVDFDQMLDILNSGPLGSIQLSLKTPTLKGRSFDNPPSDIDTAAKDLDLVLAAARESMVAMPLTAAVRQIMSQQQANGSGKKDIWSLLETFETMSAFAVPASANQ